MKAPLLDVQELTRDYVSHTVFSSPHRHRALDSVSIRMEPASIFGLVGESGSGKSTLARIVAALDRPTSGKVMFDGDDLFALPARQLMRRRSAFQMVFQDPFGSLDPRQRIGRTVAEPLHALPAHLGRRQIEDRVAEVLESVGLSVDHTRRYPHEFSGGQRQRIAIARALVTEPKLVIADEPVSALDLSVQAQILNLIMDLRERRGVAFLFISHNLAAVDCIADTVGVMYGGRIVETGPADEVFRTPLHPYSQALAAAEPSVQVQHRQKPQVRLPRRVPAGENDCAFRSRCPLAIERCATERPELRPVSAGRSVACHRPSLDRT
ncbi:peptide/nickel transport system ATP-binding protein [Ciceribacter lividus]|uniref:Peptide/nickel transport system ATP-binding protein n=1 Tax=Ciceribacter lividus TaxID=1197950 RepID=A0A6I7HP51_9HYPH|nr:oligopeptide/dipeptide ABC transporter ATP-binding protein [Ciceribacter lividus]RCW25842.1 peptide/nickel transport system ATP-binding protein [Ciceribacter lividus]